MKRKPFWFLVSGFWFLVYPWFAAANAQVVATTARGIVVAHDRQGSDPSFSEEDVRLAETLASRAALAVDLAERVSRDVVRQVVAAQEQERARLARELHDETGQALTSILLGLKPLEDEATSDDHRLRVGPRHVPTHL